MDNRKSESLQDMCIHFTWSDVLSQSLDYILDFLRCQLQCDSVPTNSVNVLWDFITVGSIYLVYSSASI